MSELAAAPPGYRWVCAGCRTLNPPAAVNCPHCGAGWTLPPAGVARRRSAGGARLLAGVPAVLELGLVAGLFALWRVAGALAGLHTAGALTRARDIWSFERWLHLPSEVWVQHLVLGSPELVRVLNVYYLAAHVVSIALFLPWLYLRHRTAYPRWRNILAAFTGVCLAIQFLPVAPPRMLSGIGLVDTGRLYHESAYGPVGSHFTDSLSSMPSVHIGWALLIAVAVIEVSRSRWRWLIVIQPAATVFAVVATANHFWLDGVAAAALLFVILKLGRVRRSSPRALRPIGQ